MKLDKKNTREIEQWIFEQRQLAIADAKYMTQEFWLNRERLLEEKLGGESGTPRLGCHVRVTKDNAVRVYWYYFKFIKQNVSGGRVINRRHNTYISRPSRGYSYNISKIKKYAHPKEYEMVEVCEMAFADVRQRLDTLKKLSLHVKTWKEITGASLEDGGVDFEKFGEADHE